jgi:hypothetical protein
VVGSESTLALTSLYIIMGAAMGLPHWLMLRREFARSLLWLASCTLGVGFGFWIVLARGPINRSELVSYVKVVLLYGVATGSVLSRLLTHKVGVRHQHAGPT